MNEAIDFLAKLDANQGLMLTEIRRLSTIVAELVATPCARCRLQLAPTIPAEDDHISDAEPLL